MEHAYELGKQSGAGKVLFSQNPYIRDSESWTAWRQGWVDGNKSTYGGNANG